MGGVTGNYPSMSGGGMNWHLPPWHGVLPSIQRGTLATSWRVALYPCCTEWVNIHYRDQSQGKPELPNSQSKSKVTIRGLGRDGLPINRWRGNISFARASLGQDCRAAPQAQRKGWCRCYSTSRASSSRFCMASWCCHCSLEACTTLATLAFLIPVAQMTSALLVEAKQTASTFFMAVP